MTTERATERGEERKKHCLTAFLTNAKPAVGALYRQIRAPERVEPKQGFPATATNEHGLVENIVLLCDVPVQMSFI